jgi:hypothetical protein
MSPAPRVCPVCGEPVPWRRRKLHPDCARTKRAAYQRAYYVRNQAKHAAYQRAYYVRNRVVVLLRCMECGADYLRGRGCPSPRCLACRSLTQRRVV